MLLALYALREDVSGQPESGQVLIRIAEHCVHLALSLQMTERRKKAGFAEV